MKGKAILAAAAVLVLSGCSQGEAPESNRARDQQRQAESSDALSRAIDTAQQAKQKTNEAAKQENDRLSQTINETDMHYAEQYDQAILRTNLGDITVRLYGSDSPATVDNFLKLADRKFYDGTKFHRVIKGFMVQGGDPNSKDDDWSNDGTGGPGYVFDDEINPHKLVRGSLAMANAGKGPDGKGTNGSQFFIVTAESTPWLDGKHTNFGEVVKGMDIVDKIEAAKTNANDHPLENIVIKSIEPIKKK
jgi:cyclophilin family peptidyl-prolyl cis-trans isomerase